MRYFVTLDSSDREHAVDVTTRPDGSLEARVDGNVVSVDVAEVNGALNVRVGERVFDLWLDGEGDALRVVAGGLRTRATVESDRSRIGARASRAAAGAAGGRITAPMPGRVVKVLVSEGEVVEAGRPLVVVEAMKMENELCAEGAGTVQAVRAVAGQTVDSGAVLVELGPLPSV